MEREHVQLMFPVSVNTNSSAVSRDSSLPAPSGEELSPHTHAHTQACALVQARTHTHARVSTQALTHIRAHTHTLHGLQVMIQ